MAVTSVEKIMPARTGEISTESSRFSITYRVICNSPDDGPATICSAAGIPAIYSTYAGIENTTRTDCLLKSKSCQQLKDDSGWNVWHVQCNYDNALDENQPTAEEALFWVETEFVEKDVWRTWDNKDIKNSAGQLFQGLKKIEAVETWVFERVYTSINRSTWLNYQNSVNNDVFYELQPYEGLMNIIVPKPVYRNGNWEWRVQFRIRINKEEKGWRAYPIDRGTLQKSPANPAKLEQIVDKNLKQLDGPQNLDGSGRWVGNDSTALVFRGPYDIYKPLAWAVLGLTPPQT